jgi:hypothetical protein
MIMRRIHLVFLSAVLVSVAGLSLHFLAFGSEAVGPTAPYQMKLDATAGGTVNASRNVVGSAAFSIGVHVTGVSQPYSGYNWQLQFPTIALAFVAGSAVSRLTAS